MNFIVIIAITIIASARGLPQCERFPIDLRDERLVNNNIKDAIEDSSQYIKDAGFDPLAIEKLEYIYKLPLPIIFNSTVLIEEFLSNGMSNIKVNSVDYSFIASRLNFDIELPLIDLSVRNASANATLFGNKFKMVSSGKVEIQRMRFVGQIRISLGIITGITIRSVNMKFSMESINPDVKLIAQDTDYSDKMIKFLGTIVPETFKAYSSEINELLEILLLDGMNQYLKSTKPSI